MSYLLFLDESGQDHRTMPYEVRSGVALHAAEVRLFVQAMQRLELASFGTALDQFGTELKGCKLLDRDRFKWAEQGSRMPDEERSRLCRSFLTKGLERKSPHRAEFTTNGQASLEMATGSFELLRQCQARLFAAAMPRSVIKPDTHEAEEYLRKDHVFLLERYFCFLAPPPACRGHTGHMKMGRVPIRKGGNAVKATRKRLLGRASENSVRRARREVKMRTKYENSFSRGADLVRRPLILDRASKSPHRGAPRPCRLLSRRIRGVDFGVPLKNFGWGERLWMH